MDINVDFEFKTDDGNKGYVEGNCLFVSGIGFQKHINYEVEEVTWTIVDENGNPIKVNETDEMRIEKKVIKLAEKEL